MTASSQTPSARSAILRQNNLVGVRLRRSPVDGYYHVELSGCISVNGTPLRLREIPPGWSDAWVGRTGWEVVGFGDRLGPFYEAAEAIAAVLTILLDPDDANPESPVDPGREPWGPVS